MRLSSHFLPYSFLSHATSPPRQGPMDGPALAAAVLAASNEANDAAPGAKPKAYTFKLSCGVTYVMNNASNKLFVEMYNVTGTVCACTSSCAGRRRGAGACATLGWLPLAHGGLLGGQEVCRGRLTAPFPAPHPDRGHGTSKVPQGQEQARHRGGPCGPHVDGNHRMYLIQSGTANIRRALAWARHLVLVSTAPLRVINQACVRHHPPLPPPCPPDARESPSCTPATLSLTEGDGIEGRGWHQASRCISRAGLAGRRK